MGDKHDVVIAGDQNTDKKVLEQLSKSHSSAVRGAVAANPNTSNDTLLMLVGDESNYVVERLHENNRVFPRTSLVKPVCKHTKLRLVSPDDAKFILGLRLNSNLSMYLSRVEDDLGKQEKWLAEYKNRENKWMEFYFIITSLTGSPLGTVRLYDFKGGSFCWGSWMVRQDAPIFTAIESALSVYELAFYRLGFSRSHFSVHKDNVKVIRFHKSFGAHESSSDSDNLFFTFSRRDYEETKKRYDKFFL